MAVLNIRHRCRIGASGIKYLPNQSNITKWHDFSKKPYWYLEVCDCNSFKESYWLKAIPVAILNGIKQGNITLAISNFAESFVSIVEPIYELLLGTFGINEENLILFTGSRDILPEIARISLLYNKKQIKVILTSEFEYEIQRGEKTNNIVKKHNYTPSRKFVNLNRRWRPHRPAFVSLLVLNSLTQYGHISLSNTDNNGSWETDWNRMINSFPSLREMFEANKETLTGLQFNVDNHDLDVNPKWYHPELQEIHNDSYFSIVSETNYHNTEPRFLTEKTFKAIQFKHPFVLLAPPHSLPFLREKGYMSFSPFIDERYDSEENDEKRLSMVLEETKRLCSMSNNQVATFINSTIEICEFNYKVLTTKTSFSVELT